MNANEDKNPTNAAARAQGDDAARERGDDAAQGGATMQQLAGYRRHSEQEMRERSAGLLEQLRRRRSVRDFSADPVPDDVIRNCLLAAGSAPSGANQQPWHFCVVRDPAVKRRIRLAAEEEERAFYAQRAPQAWLDALAPLGTDASKPFLEMAPVLIVIFAQKSGTRADGSSIKHYYVPESVGIASGFLIAALHHAGLATLTHTPSPMGFLNEICARPEREKASILLVAGYPAPGCQVPVHGGLRKPLDEIASWL